MGNQQGTVSKMRSHQRKYGPQKAIYIDPNTGDVVEYEFRNEFDDNGNVISDTRKSTSVSRTGERAEIDFNTPFPTRAPRKMCSDKVVNGVKIGDTQCKNWAQGTGPDGKPLYSCPNAKCMGTHCDCGTYMGKDELGVTKEMSCVKHQNTCCQKLDDWGRCIEPQGKFATQKPYEWTRQPYVPYKSPTDPPTDPPIIMSETNAPVDDKCSQFSDWGFTDNKGREMTGEQLCNLFRS
jgi:hypothetical protein